MRQYKVFTIVIQVVLGIHFAYGGFERTSQPTALFSRAFSGIGMYSSDNYLMNPASLSRITSFQSSMYYSPSPFQLHQLSNYGLMCSQSFNGVNVAGGVQSFGFSLYREITASIGVGKMITNQFGVGLNLHLYHLSIEGYGSSLVSLFDLGSIYSISDQFNVGIVLQNVTGSSFGSDDDLPRVILSGISYMVTENAVINFDIMKDIRYSITYRTGVEFTLQEIVIVRAGTEGETSRIFGGIEVQLAAFMVSYGIATHSALGLTHSIGIAFHR